MTANTHLAVDDFDRDIDREELLGRLADLKRQAAHQLPILDDDDEEAAIEEAVRDIAEP
ncbi:hypothetical protein [Actinacidiphila glaucinigra]|uniref:Uncharacterized protein n=1 Tax=Actinacidiphila glaucinigra TaxID=235986 RepID=A0A239NVQ2_9ACTN|nr:hypothetical protein [Actinacidiphila glaucinigra]SNT58424.1 hypothetical protein SAMN05216252_14912 [Actinacidiphila glaucinigra]